MRDKPTIEWVLARYGIRTQRLNGGVFIPCPKHAEKTASCSIHETWWYCFGCGANGDSIGLIAAITKQPIADVLREFGDEQAPTWKRRTTVAMDQTSRPLRLAKAYRGLHSWFFRALASRLEGAPDWLLLRAAEFWGEQFDEVHIKVEAATEDAETALKALQAQAERGLEVEGSMWEQTSEGLALLKLGVPDA
jgi:hypothetical protein